jgi:hypothetical protein
MELTRETPVQTDTKRRRRQKQMAPTQVLPEQSTGK